VDGTGSNFQSSKEIQSAMPLVGALEVCKWGQIFILDISPEHSESFFFAM
jgi:hypothetical protein